MRVVHLLEAMGGTDHLWGKERVVQWLMEVQAAQNDVQPELLTFVPSLLHTVTMQAGFPSRVLATEHSAVPLDALRALVAILHALPNTVVHSHGYKANVVARLARLRGAPMRGLIATCHGFDTYARRLAVYNAVDRFTAFGSTITTVTDPRMALKFPPWTKARYVANALPAQAEPDTALRTRGRDEYRWPPGHFAVGMLHRLIPQKGVDTFIEAAALAKRWDRSDILWVIAGEGPQRELVETAARENPNIIYLGYVDPPDMYLAALDAFIQPSRSEGLSLALLQAMRAAKTIVATRVGATELTVRDGYEGMLIDSEDPAALAAAVILLADDRAHAAQLGQAARSRFTRDFQIERQAADFLALYREAISPA